MDRSSFGWLGVGETTSAPTYLHIYTYTEVTSIYMLQVIDRLYGVVGGQVPLAVPGRTFRRAVRREAHLDTNIMPNIHHSQLPSGPRRALC